MKVFLQRLGAILLGALIALALLAVMFYITGCGSPDHAMEESTAPSEAAVQESSAESPADPAVISFTFETETLDGEPVSSEELFAENKYTMINVWTSWCPYCIEEMPGLEKMNAVFAGKGCRIVGVLFDAYEEGGLEDGKAIVDELGLTYQNIKVWKTWKNEIGMTGVPTSFFVDSKGRLAGEPIVGANLAQYEKTLVKLLGE